MHQESCSVRKWTALRNIQPKAGELLKDLFLLEEVIEGVLYHHENFDGSGYPKGLKGADIPLPTRIIRVADSFDAMTADRVYHPKLSITKAIQAMAATVNYYDPLILNSFYNVQKELTENLLLPNFNFTVLKLLKRRDNQ